MTSLGQVGRRLYSDLVTRRSTLRIVPVAETAGHKEQPIFIVGVYRSGTTLMRYIVDSHSRICCPPESDFLLPVLRLLDDDRTLPSLDNMGFDDEHVLARIRDFSNYFFENYAHAVNKPRWADKTPSYVECLYELKRVYPNAQFVMIYRHGLDQAHSMTRAGTYQRPVLDPFCIVGEDLRIGATRYWVQQVNKMLAFERDNPEQTIRVHYEDLCVQPDREMRRVFEFLGEQFEPEALEYGNFVHTKGKEDGAAGANTAIAPASHHHQAWEDQLRSACTVIAHESLEELAYLGRSSG